MLQNTWALDYSAKSLHYVSGSAVDTVEDLYKWVQDEMDELMQLDDDVPMKYDTPTEYQLINGWTIPDADYQYLKGGSVVVNKSGGNDVWANIYTIGTIEAGTQVYVAQDGAILPSWWPAGHIDILVKIREAGVLTDSGRLVVYARELSDKYDHFEVTVTGGRSAVPLATEDDINNQTDAATLATYNDITITFGAVNKDLSNGNSARPYDVVIDCATRPLSQVYEYLKYITRRGSDLLLSGVEGQQYVSADPDYTDVKASPFGTYQGGTFFGARGVWIENYDAADAKNLQLIDSEGTTQNPPNVVPVRVTGVATGDRVAIFRLTAADGDIEKTEYTYSAESSGTSFVINETISSDTPQTGTIRIGAQRLEYTSWAGSTFTLAADPGTFADNEPCYVPILDIQASGKTAQATLTYSSDIPVLVRVRQYGILPFEVESTITDVGLSVAAIRNPDAIAT